MPTKKYYSDYKGESITTDKKLKFPIHADNTVDKWCEGCGRKLNKKLEKRVTWNPDTGQKEVTLEIGYRCPHLQWGFASIWSHDWYKREYEDMEAS